jgi:RNA polymerase sigma-70 factor (ECF subfamily)
MSDASLDTMLEKLSLGDQEAAARVFREYEPFLRAMVRRRLAPALRSKFDSLDVVQTVWADVLSGFREKETKFTDRSHLRAFLARVTYNHFITHCRRHGPQAAIEQPLYEDESGVRPVSVEPRPSQVAQADELWESLVEMCPPAHRQVLELKKQGVPLAEIAEKTGLHESSVRRLLYDLAKRLAARSARSYAR